MDTKHNIYFTQSQDLSCLKSESVDLVVTSPPYPMIEMWDDIMSKQNPIIATAIQNTPQIAFEMMHQELDKVWKECYRLLKDGGFMCVNIGDATRTIHKDFQLYNNHARIVDACTKIGFSNLPNIIWRKQTNSPNKFMGSGMLPCGAYVTLEHEWILIFRKGGKRVYKKETEKQQRRNSSFFWEERNNWFSDIWEIKGTKQKIANPASRERSASFPLEIPFRLINMYSQQGDVVLDPFFGLGTTSIAAMVTMRNSIGIEIDPALSSSIRENIEGLRVNDINAMIYERYQKHVDFIKEREAMGKAVKYANKNLGCKVMTSQEKDMNLYYVSSIRHSSLKQLQYEVEYHDNIPIVDFDQTQHGLFFNIKENENISYTHQC